MMDLSNRTLTATIGIDVMIEGKGQEYFKPGLNILSACVSDTE